MSKILTPWNDISTEKKLSLLNDAKEKGKSIALLLYPSPDSSTFRYRGYNTFCATKKHSKKWQLIYFFMSEMHLVKNLIDKKQVKILILSRVKPWSFELDDLAIAAHEKGIPVMNDLDDCICGQKYIKTMFNTVAPDEIDQNYWINASAQFELVSQLCDGFIATNDYLGKILSNSHDNKPYYVINNSFNKEQLEYSEFLVEKKGLNHSKKTKFRLGYFSGSATHAADFEVIYPELINILSSYEDIVLRIVGKMNLPASATPFIKTGQIELYPVVDYLELQRLISEVDINLAPLCENTFTNCKSELKFFEAAIVKTVTIASPTYAFAHSIKNGETGFLCRPGEWKETILKIYNSPSLGEEIAKNAEKYCKKYYSPEHTKVQLENAFCQILNNMVQ